MKLMFKQVLTLLFSIGFLCASHSVLADEMNHSFLTTMPSTNHSPLRQPHPLSPYRSINHSAVFSQLPTKTVLAGMATSITDDSISWQTKSLAAAEKANKARSESNTRKQTFYLKLLMMVGAKSAATR